jgi:hypothetical protein
MYDGGKIITGLVIALAFLTFPFWWNKGQAAQPKPVPVITDQTKAMGPCIQPKEKMITTHMQILDDWRNKVVRDAQRYEAQYAPKTREPEMVAVEGAIEVVDNSLLTLPVIGPTRDLVSSGDPKLNVGNAVQIERSLQNSCMKCHTSKKDFCDKCHTYANVDPTCWDCHVAPEEKKQ